MMIICAIVHGVYLLMNTKGYCTGSMHRMLSPNKTKLTGAWASRTQLFPTKPYCCAKVGDVGVGDNVPLMRGIGCML
jgi:hypothetical protein